MALHHWEPEAFQETSVESSPLLRPLGVPGQGECGRLAARGSTCSLESCHGQPSHGTQDSERVRASTHLDYSCIGGASSTDMCAQLFKKARINDSCFNDPGVLNDGTDPDGYVDKEFHDVFPRLTRHT